MPADFGAGFARALGDGADLAPRRREQRQQPIRFAEIAAAEDDGLCAELTWGHRNDKSKLHTPHSRTASLHRQVHLISCTQDQGNRFKFL